MIHTGVVRELRGSSAMVAVDTSQCGSCSTRSTCYGLSGKPPEERLLPASNTVSASVGDRVEVEFKTTASMTAIFVTFLLPVLTLGAGYLLLRNEGAFPGVAGAVGGLFCGLGLAWVINRRLCSGSAFGLSVVSVLEKGN